MYTSLFPYRKIINCPWWSVSICEYNIFNCSLLSICIWHRSFFCGWRVPGFQKLILYTKCAYVCVCPPPRLVIISGVMWRDIDLIWLVKQVLQLLYGSYSSSGGSGSSEVRYKPHQFPCSAFTKNTIQQLIQLNMWPDLRKAGFQAHNSKTHFSPSNNSRTCWLTI